MQDFNILYEQYRKEMDKLNMSAFPFECTETLGFKKELYMTYEELEEKDLVAGLLQTDAQLFAFKHHRQFGKYPAGVIVVDATQKNYLGSFTHGFVKKCLPLTLPDIANNYNEHAELLKLDKHAYAYMAFRQSGKYPGNIKTAPTLQGKLKEMEICLLCNMPKDELMMNGGMERLYQLDKAAANAKLAA